MKSLYFWLLMMPVFIALPGCESRMNPATPVTDKPAINNNGVPRSLPDWSGSWSTFFGPLEVEQALTNSLKPAPLTEFHEILGRFLAADLNLRDLYCGSYLFGGFSEGAEGNIEFLFTPDRVTMIWEGGLVRRIYTGPAAVAADPQISNSGISAGHWEGDTLVVQTDLHPDAGPLLGYLKTPSFRVGEGAHLTERIFLKEPDILQMDIELSAPSILSRPAKLTAIYRRDRQYRMSDYTRCTPNDRSVDLQTGRLRQDLTPPKDLPPPPSE